MKRLYLDTETTGLNPEEHSIWQVSSIVEVDGAVEERLNLYIRPWDGALISKGAIPKNMADVDGFRRWLREQPASQEQFNRFIKMLRYYVNPFDKRDKFWFIAYNAGFDDKFVRAWFQRHNDKYFGSYFLWPPIDVAVLAAEYVGKDRLALDNFRLETVATHLGCKTDGEAHDAEVDCEWMRNIYLKVRQNGRTGG